MLFSIEIQTLNPSRFGAGIAFGVDVSLSKGQQ